MPIPNYQQLLLPYLKIIDQNSPISLRESVTLMVSALNLTAEEKELRVPSGRSYLYQNRIGWTKTYLHKAGLISLPSRGMIAITPRGKEVLAQNHASLDLQFLKRFPEFQAFQSASKNSTQELENSGESAEDKTPEELLESAYSVLRHQVLADILEQLKNNTPEFFERTIVDVIVKMGYGGSTLDAGCAIGKSGDEGIDGIINEDKLGLDVIYLQAKRWQGVVGRPEIQKFAGALQGKRAKKGIFISTSDFTNEAKEYVKNIDVKIILISGSRLAELMWEYNVGVSMVSSFEVKRIDLDYFEY